MNLSASHIASRICHDLVTPVGAMLSGLELMEDSGMAEREIIDLLKLSASTASQRLMLYRLCFGQGATSGLNSLSELEGLLEKTLDQNKHALRFNANSASDRHITEKARIICLALGICLESLPYGGSISISCEGDAVKIAGTGERVVMHEDLKKRLSANTNITDTSARTILADICQQTCAEINVGTQIEITSDTLALTFDEDIVGQFVASS